MRARTFDLLVQLRLKDDLSQEIDDWRRLQREIPTKSEAIRQLVRHGLDAEAERRRGASPRGS